MIQKFAIQSIRKLKARPFISLVNLIGLSVSFTFGLFLFLYIDEQSSYDKHFQNYSDIYRVNSDFLVDDSRNIYSNSPRPVAPNIAMDYPEVQTFSRIYGIGGLEVHTGLLEFDNKIIESKEIFVADSTFFDVFDHPILARSDKNPLSRPNSIVLSKALARKIYGTDDVIGKPLKLNGGRSIRLKVTGVFEKHKQKSHLEVEALISWITYGAEWELDQWFGSHVFSYIRLVPGADIDELRSKMPGFYEKYMKSTFDPLNGSANILFQPVSKIHLDDELLWEPYPHGDRRNIQILKLVVALLLLFSIINYVNLATASGSERHSEVGMKKILGSSRAWIFNQFMLESLFLSTLAGFISLALTGVGLPFYQAWTNIEVDPASINSFRIVALVFGVSVLAGIIAGLYPALYLSNVSFLKHSSAVLGTKPIRVRMRQALVGIQYFMAAALISMAVVVWQQNNFLRSIDLGYDPEGVYLVEMPYDSTIFRNIGAFRDRIKEIPTVGPSSVLSFSMTGTTNEFAPTLELPDGSTRMIGAEVIDVDEDFAYTFGLKLVQGENLRITEPRKVATILVNEAFLESFQWIKNPEDIKLQVGWLEDEKGNPVKFPISGVVKDFYIGSTSKLVEPMVMLPKFSSFGRNLSVKINSTDQKAAVEEIRSVWEELFPLHPFVAHSLDQDLEKQYKKENQFFGQLSLFTFLLILIASLGVIGLISFNLELRQKEIAIRKVIGARSYDLGKLLTKDFIILIVISNILAIPVSQYFSSMWLQNFNQQIELGYGQNIVSFLVCFLFTILASLYHLTRIQSSNPVNFLSQE